jgi:glycosyltransferase involved in cell wall biosynthesis
VIAVSERQVAPLAELGYRRERIVVVPNGLFDSDVELGAPREATRGTLGLDEDDFAVLCVANLRPEKGVSAFVEAVARARRQVPRLVGLVAGDGPQRAELERLTVEGEGVRLLGSRSDVPDLLAACDAFCLLSDAEALPISILEAMTLGRPVVATDVGGIPEAVVHAQTGLIVPPGDGAAAAGALARLAAQPDWAAGLGERGAARRRERFGGEAMVDEYVRVFEEAVASGQA